MNDTQFAIEAANIFNSNQASAKICRDETSLLVNTYFTRNSLVRIVREIIRLEFGGRIIKIRPGDDAQRIIDGAKPGDKIIIEAGTYTEPIIAISANIEAEER